MEGFLAPNPNVEVKGYFVLAYLEALGKEVQPIAEKFGLIDIQPEQWIPYQAYLNLLKELSSPSLNSIFDFVKVGMKVAELSFDKVSMPLSIIDWFLALPQSAAQIYRGASAEDFVKVRQVSPNHIEVLNSAPGSCDLYYGVYYVAARRLRPGGTDFSVTHRSGSCRKQGDTFCIFDVEYWKTVNEDDL